MNEMQRVDELKELPQCRNYWAVQVAPQNTKINKILRRMMAGVGKIAGVLDDYKAGFFVAWLLVLLCTNMPLTYCLGRALQLNHKLQPIMPLFEFMLVLRRDMDNFPSASSCRVQVILEQQRILNSQVSFRQLEQL